MSLRERFVSQVRQGGVQVSTLCREFGISRQTGYKWLKRYDEAGVAGLADQSRRPQHSPRQTGTVMEKVIIAARQAHPAWGGRKLKRWLLSNAQRIEPDRQRRVIVPQRLRDIATISDKVLIAGMDTYLELWQPEAWDDHDRLLEQEAADQDFFASLVI